jgi:hypothetical protein
MIGRFFSRATMPTTAHAKEGIVFAAYALVVTLEGDHDRAASRGRRSDPSPAAAVRTVTFRPRHLFKGPRQLGGGKWGHSLATAIIAYIFLTGGTIFLVEDAPVKITRDLYLRATGALSWW